MRVALTPLELSPQLTKAAKKRFAPRLKGAA